jgi:hypothetical protein
MIRNRTFGYRTPQGKGDIESDAVSERGRKGPVVPAVAEAARAGHQI